MSMERIRRRSQSLEALARLKSHPDHVLVVHYSCESFYDRKDGTSPRITSVAVRNWGSGQTRSFSIHQVAERKGIAPGDITASYDSYEKTMLKDFFDFADKHEKFTWLHWNMRDINYGFAAIEHRAQVVGLKSDLKIHEDRRADLARILFDLFGGRYIEHPRLTQLIDKNSITRKDYLDGQQEADAFLAGDYVKLNQSTLRKVDILANVLERTLDGSLKTNATWRDKFGGFWPWLLWFMKEHWITTLIAFLSGVLALVQWVWSVV